ncbi:piggyBac transposable element-derived protein 4 [Condylostylus longicornis]|uniref:piggyBac transposable element-derived protein 4 n=1 Tax=Condylostylus longicornis TaxID=2530218 RepID=UPI00244E025D|nr:piggyBac transposable element-derived protein 4 [Condylostylus longicornis]
MDEIENIYFEEDLEDILSDIPSEYAESDESSDSRIFVPRQRVMRLSDSSENDVADENLDWSETDLPRNLNDFEGASGVKIFPENRDSVENVTSLFIGDDLFSTICEETNKYYSQNRHKYKKVEHTAKWYDVTNIELKKWFALVIIMGLVKKNSIADCWSTNPLIEMPIFRKTMTRNRFQQILTFLHFSDNSIIPSNSNRLIKIQYIIDYFCRKFMEIYTPNQNLSLDEGMIPWRGRLKFRVYNPMKIVKYGILNRMLCESKTGYICNFKLYSGESNNLRNTITEVLAPYLNKWHNIYADNFYNSVDLANHLYSLKTRICGTIRANRGLPAVLKKPKLNINESIYRRKGEVLLQVWQAKKTKQVTMISTIHQAEIHDTGKIDRKTGLSIRKPISVIDYNNFMSGVVLPINISHTILFLKKQKNGPKKLAESWLTEKNSYSDEDIEASEPSTSFTRTPRADKRGRLSGSIKQHELIKIFSDKANKFVRRNCRVCSAHKIRKPSAYMCKSCKVALHIGECFQKYHTNKKY